MKPVLFAAAAAVIALQTTAYAADAEEIGPFVDKEPGRTTLIKLVCLRQPGRLDCQFAATQIGKRAKSGECYVDMNSYPVSLKANGDGRWAATKTVPQCKTGRTDYRLELDDKSPSVARLIISGCSDNVSTLNYDAKGISWTPNCTVLSTMNHPETINRIRRSK